MKYNCQQCKKGFKAPPSQRAKFCGLECKYISFKGKSFSSNTQFKKCHNTWNKNKKLSSEYKRKISLGTKKAMQQPEVKRKMDEVYNSRKGKTFEGSDKGWFTTERSKGDKNVNWKGGVSPLHNSIRNSKIYHKWRKEVYARDYWTCQCCGEKPRDIVAHHIYPFSQYPEYRFDLKNGMTLCRPCHPYIEQVTS